MFQASDAKRRSFLELLDNDLNTIKLMYSKKSLWLKYSGHSNSLYVKASRTIVNHTPIEE